MRKKTKNILSVVPHTRYLGISILVDTDLREWAIKSIKGFSFKSTKIRAQAIITRYINEFDVEVLVLKKPDPQRSSKNLKNLVRAIQNISRKKNIHTITYSLNEIKQALITQKRKNKSNLLYEVTSHYPFLRGQFEKEKNQRNKYYTRMFESIALGLTYLSK